jgi:Mg2+ and Co2+ transporter CorA
MALFDALEEVTPLLLDPNKVTLALFDINLKLLETRSKTQALSAIPIYRRYLGQLKTKLESARDCIIRHIEKYSEETISLHLKVLEQQEREPGKPFLGNGEILKRSGLEKVSDMSSQAETTLIREISAMFADQLCRIDDMLTRLGEMEKKFMAMPD